MEKNLLNTIEDIDDKYYPYPIEDPAYEEIDLEYFEEDYYDNEYEDLIKNAPSTYLNSECDFFNDVINSVISPVIREAINRAYSILLKDKIFDPKNIPFDILNKARPRKNGIDLLDDLFSSIKCKCKLHIKNNKNSNADELDDLLDLILNNPAFAD
ncbi:MAG: hypothetical protein ACFFDN_00795 [Candidatus Hodarchaeota archaeon]